MNTPTISISQNARFWQIFFLSTFLTFGIFQLNWDADAICFISILGTALLTQLAFIYAKDLALDGLQSALITGLGMCILFKSDRCEVLVLGAFLAISSKFLIRFRGKHLFNPANFGIVTTILLTHHAWISPGQWGSQPSIALLIASAGALVLLRCGRIGTGLVFLTTFLGISFVFNILYRGWPVDFWWHQAFNGSIWLFSLFMITDPMTTPNNPTVRLIWAALVAMAAFYLQQFHWVIIAPVWVLFFATPLVPFIDQFFKDKPFKWLSES